MRRAAVKGVRHVKVIDHGYAAEIANTSRLASRGVKVGIQAGQSTDVSAGGKPADLLDVLIWNEFGTRRAPPRPVMRSYFDADLSHLEAEARNAALFIFRTGAVDAALHRLGSDMQARLQAHWRASKSWAVPNSPFTIRMKGSDVPLIDHAVLINAVRYQVV